MKLSLSFLRKVQLQSCLIGFAVYCIAKPESVKDYFICFLVGFLIAVLAAIVSYRINKK